MFLHSQKFNLTARDIHLTWDFRTVPNSDHSKSYSLSLSFLFALPLFCSRLTEYHHSPSLLVLVNDRRMCTLYSTQIKRKTVNNAIDDDGDNGDEMIINNKLRGFITFNLKYINSNLKYASVHSDVRLFFLVHQVWGKRKKRMVQLDNSVFLKKKSKCWTQYTSYI